MGKAPNIPSQGAAAAAGIQADTENQPFSYLVNAAATLGAPITITGPDGKQHTYDFTGQGNADNAAAVSDKMAQTLLDIQKEKDPQIIQQRIDELKAADPQGYAARQQLFDSIMQDANTHPGRPVSDDLQKQLQDNLAKGAGFDDSRQEQQVRDTARGSQVMRGIYLGNSAASDEAKQVVGAGETLRNQRQQDSLNMLESGASPEDVAYRQMEQTYGNLGRFAAGQTPEAEFRQVSSASQPTVSLTGQAPNTNTFNPNAAQSGFNNALGVYQGLNGQANPWMAGLSTAATTFGSLNQKNQWFGYNNADSNAPIYSSAYYPTYAGTTSSASGIPGQQE